MAKIDSTLFSQCTSALEEKQYCPECGGTVAIKNSKHGLFKSCVNYPDCKYIQPFNSNSGRIIKNLSVACPECESELVLRQGRFGMFIGCSAYPKCQHRENRELKKESELSNVSCPDCKTGLLQEKQSRFGKRFYACDAYPKCKFAINTKPISGQCDKCNYSLLIEKSSADEKALFCANKKCQHKVSNG